METKCKNCQGKRQFADKIIDKNIVVGRENDLKVKKHYPWSAYLRHIPFCKTKAMYLITCVYICLPLDISPMQTWMGFASTIECDYRIIREFYHTIYIY